MTKILASICCSFHIRKEKKKCKKCKKSSKVKEKRKVEPLTDLYPTLPQVSIPRNPSPFGVYVAIRNTCLDNKRKQATLLQLQCAAAWKELEEALAEPADSSSDEAAKKQINLPKIVGIGLQGVIEIIRESQTQHPMICKKALSSLLNILQGLQPEELSNEPASVIGPMFDTLLELSSLESDETEIRSLGCACLLSLAVAYGDTGKMLLAASAMLMAQPRNHDLISMPHILVSLQRSVVSVMLGKLEHPNFMTHGVPASSLVDNFEVKITSTSPRPDAVFSLASDGSHIYLQSNLGLFKIGSGYGGTIRGHVYQVNSEFYSKPGWLGYVRGKLYFKPSSGRDMSLVDTLDLSVIKEMDVVGHHVENDDDNEDEVMFSDGTNVGIVQCTASDKFVVKFLDPNNNFTVTNELPLKLARKCVDVFGASIFEEGHNKHQVDFGCDDESLSLQTGKDFALMLSCQGRVYYTGRNIVLKNSIESK